MKIELAELMKNHCAWHKMLVAGKLVNGSIVIDDETGQKIIDECARVRGLGDIIHTVADPIARVIDFAFGTDLKNCNSCAERRDHLNAQYPIKKI
jgi:5-methylthioribose kinase